MLRLILISIVRAYQALAPLFKTLLGEPVCSCCRWTPSCSAYAIEAVEQHGAAKGSYLTLRRLLRCHPWSGKGGCDPVPPCARHVFNRPLAERADGEAISRQQRTQALSVLTYMMGARVSCNNESARQMRLCMRSNPFTPSPAR